MNRRLGIALLPDGECIQRAITLQNIVESGANLVPVLSTDGNLPHITLYQGYMKDSFTDQRAEELLAHIRSLISSDSICLQGSEIHHQPRGWIFQNFDHEPLLFDLQNEVLSKIEPHIDLDRVDRARDVSQYSAAEASSYLRYGYRYVQDAFRPHITLGRCDEDSANELVQAATNKGLGIDQWRFDRLSCYVMGEHGAHTATVVAAALADSVVPLQTS